MNKPQHYEPMHMALHERNFPHRIIDGIWMWSVFSEEKEMHFNGFLVQTGPDEAFIVDPPCAGDDVLKAFVPLPKPTFILITNRDHERDAEAFRRHFDIPVYAPETDAPLMELSVDRVYRDGDLLNGGWKVIHLPHQKSPGESALYQPERSVLILGDALIGKPLQHLSMLPNQKYADKLEAVQGLQQLLELDIKTVLTADGDPVLANAADMVADALVAR